MDAPRHSPSDHPGRRQAPRYQVDADVLVSAPVEAHGFVINASDEGLRIAVDRSLPEGELCVLEIATDDGKTAEVARVAWVRGQPDGYLVGVSFVRD